MYRHESLSVVQQQLYDFSISCVQILEDYLRKIEESKEINAFVEVFSESALAKAEEVDEKIKAGKAGKLAGLVISIKDNICYEGHTVSASSKILSNFESLYSSTVVQRLLKEDAIIIGRTNCDEFAMGSSNENSYLGPVRNPKNKNKVPGGSSGGAAASVAAGLCMASLGSDTGGSIRQPASFCGIVGMKPSYGRVSRHGLIAFASSFDQIGPFGKNVEDIAAILEVIAGADDYDSTLSRRKVPAYKSLIEKKSSTPKKIAFLDCYVNHGGINDEVKEGIEKSIEELRNLGHQVEEVSFDYLDHMVPAYNVLTTAEASSNLARYDGIHFGYRSEDATDLESTYVKSRVDGFGKEVKRRIMLGTFVLSSGYYDAYYSKAQKVRRLVKEKTDEILSEYDFIISPTTPHPAFDIGEKSKDPIKMYLEDIFTVQANLAGIPAISLPLFETKEGLPFGFQLMTKSFYEEQLLGFSNQLMNIFPLKKQQDA